MTCVINDPDLDDSHHLRMISVCGRLNLKLQPRSIPAHIMDHSGVVRHANLRAHEGNYCHYNGKGIGLLKLQTSQDMSNVRISIGKDPVIPRFQVSSC